MKRKNDSEAMVWISRQQKGVIVRKKRLQELCDVGKELS